MLKIPIRAYTALSRILRFPGTEGLSGMQREIVPTQELTRVMQEFEIVHMAYFFDATPAASDSPALDWADESDWREVLRNGSIIGTDADLPAITDDRLLITASLRISGTAADYTSASVSRISVDSASGRLKVRDWGAIAGITTSPLIVGINELPVPLGRGETIIRPEQIVTGNAAVFTWVFEYLSATPGVMSRYPGI